MTTKATEGTSEGTTEGTTATATEGGAAARRVVGIDLGTTHTALAYAEGGETRVLPIPQLVGRGVVEARPLLPSFLYLAHESEGPEPLPWDASRTFAVGEHARARGVDAPSRLVSSAKSWLSHRTVDRRAGVLPLGAPGDVERISPVEASWRYLEHLVEAFEHAGLGALGGEEVYVTVPASFDAAARDLTVEAALAAGLERVTLLEEPQAALYAWLASRGDAWRKRPGATVDEGTLEVGDVVLVLDVGGGTTDLSAISVVERDGTLELVRLAVGDHILLGGDNMDLALAHLAKQKLEAQGATLDRAQLAALGHAARAAKERLLAPDAPERAPIGLGGRGSRLVGGALSTELSRAEVERTIVEGFFPRVPASARPAVRARVGLAELGLAYASEPAVTKHLAAFLSRQAGALPAREGERAPSLLCPTAVLFNGGVMKSELLRARVMETLDAWLAAEGRPPARALAAPELELGVAKGAVFYGLARRGQGLRIRGGTARAYYVGIEGSAPAVPGVEPPLTALCVAPMGMEEGTQAELPRMELGVVVGEAVRFRFFGSSVRRDDRAGAVLERWGDELEELSPIEITLPAEGRVVGDVVPVTLEAGVTPIGTLLLEAVPEEPSKPGERFRIELSVRGDEA